MRYSYLVVSEDESNAKEMLSLVENYPEYVYAGSVTNKEEAVDAMLEWRPQLVFLDIGAKPKNNISLGVIAELYRYINTLPHFVVLADNDKLAIEAIKSGVFDYLIKPVNPAELRKTLLKFQKYAATLYQLSAPPPPDLTIPDDDVTEDRAIAETQKSDVDIQICIKSYGDYQFIALKDVVYLEADNNTTDFYLLNGKKLSAYKTLKHYENNLPSFFYRIHNSYIVNSNYVSRINTGKQLCYLNNNEVSVSFSKTFKENIDTIIRKIAPEYL